ncbi:MAG: hypothetical protein KC421_03070 [Anaerolineales bacterium]|nr:hypothetical protein [Anaerolineales bacterium]
MGFSPPLLLERKQAVRFLRLCVVVWCKSLFNPILNGTGEKAITQSISGNEVATCPAFLYTIFIEGMRVITTKLMGESA